MKRLFLAITICTSLFYAAQEKNLVNIQTGFVGVWINDEVKIANQFAIRGEIGLEPRWLVGTGTEWHNNFRIEPRYYYNLNKREAQGKKTAGNSANFMAVELNYRPAYVVFRNDRSLTGYRSYSIVPKWGLRRIFAQHWSYEAGLGLGYRRDLKDKSRGIYEGENFAEIDLYLRIGYTF